ncbi:MAG: hypothetical protein RMJ98_10805 [Myxococcales bacterium]|nr:hypothetical protein [Polyangiaceae bacterium]MDW8249775.1 hypothetical protein [Myxococcales bacterium]
MAAQDKPRPTRGLPSIAEARELRQSRVLPAASGQFWLWSLIAIAAMTIFYWKKTQHENEAFRARILAKQRAIAAEHGAAFFSLRDRAESWTAELARGSFEPDLIAPSLKSAGNQGDLPLFKRPGVYLRVTREDARSPEKIRAAARESLRDAFTACLLHTPHFTQHKGQPCHISKECPQGHLCNEANVCALPAQPFNLRLAYHGLRVLSDTWIRSVQSSGDGASDTLVLRRYEMDIDSALSNDLPVVTELLRQAEYFLVVVDEIPEGFQAPAGVSLAQAVQSEPHPARIALYDLKTGELLLRLHRTADVTIPVIPGDAEAIDAQRRQILNCALAQEVRDALTK